MSTLQQLRNIVRAKVGQPQQHLVLRVVRRIDDERCKCSAAIENTRRRYTLPASISAEASLLLSSMSRNSLFPSQRNALINLQSHRRMSKKTTKSSRKANDASQNTQKKYNDNDRYGSRHKRHAVEATHRETLATKTKSRRKSSTPPKDKVNTTATGHHEKTQHQPHHIKLYNNNNTSPLMSVCTKPSQLTSLHPAVRLALLHDEVKLEFRAVQHHEDPNIWY